MPTFECWFCCFEHQTEHSTETRVFKCLRCGETIEVLPTRNIGPSKIVLTTARIFGLFKSFLFKASSFRPHTYIFGFSKKFANKYFSLIENTFAHFISSLPSWERFKTFIVIIGVIAFIPMCAYENKETEKRIAISRETEMRQEKRQKADILRRQGFTGSDEKLSRAVDMIKESNETYQKQIDNDRKALGISRD